MGDFLKENMVAGSSANTEAKKDDDYKKVDILTYLYEKGLSVSKEVRPA